MWYYCKKNIRRLKLQNNKVELKNILFIVFVFIIAIIVFVLAIGYIISTVDSNHSITGYSIAISFAEIFATFWCFISRC